MFNGGRPYVVLHASAAEHAGWCCIEVRDNGIGLAADDCQCIFDPFVRLHPEEEYPGIGLGLSAVKKAVELLAGRVEVASVLGEGSTFRVWIPAWRKEDEIPDCGR
ncbi:MAG: ATP-binding protein [Armatimonadota bacterium]